MWYLYEEEVKIGPYDTSIAVILLSEEIRDEEFFQLSAKCSYPTTPSEAEFLALFSCRCGSSSCPAPYNQ